MNPIKNITLLGKIPCKDNLLGRENKLMMKIFLNICTRNICFNTTKVFNGLRFSGIQKS